MKKKLLGFVLTFVSIFVLAACSSETKKMEGKYYRYFVASNTGELTISTASSSTVIVSGDSMTVGDNQYSINEKDRLVTGSDGSLAYSYEDDVLTLDGETYVKVATDKYGEIYRQAYGRPILKTGD